MTQKSDYKYNQPEKRMIRHNIILRAVKSLTQEREYSTCVSRDYVREIYDSFVNTKDDSSNKREAELIDKRYITSWENLHDTYTSVKEVKDLAVCYLCGPEPNNDFHEFTDLGILPQNIWAFESNNSTYNQAIACYEQGEYPQPRIIKQNIDTFFKMTPKKFDIVYIDACGSVPSAQHALKTISTMCKYSRLNSPGVIITNFASPDIEKEPEQILEWVEVITNYLYFKTYPDDLFDIREGKIVSEKFIRLEQDIKNNFKLYYGEFISALLRDIPSVIVPIQRINENPYFQQFVVDNSMKYSDQEWLNMASGNSLARFFFFCYGIQSNLKGTKTELLIAEMGDLTSIVNGFKFIVGLRMGVNEVKADIRDIYEYFESTSGVYQFLDKPHSNLIFDAIINQLIYPLHFNPEKNTRYVYKAKTRDMYTDVSVYDECRYIYEWIPGIHQVKSAVDNVSWQYVFRFCIDGLIRTRINFNNEFFYQGAVVQHESGKFEKKRLCDRISPQNM